MTTLRKHLALNQFFLNSFGFRNFSRVQTAFADFHRQHPDLPFSISHILPAATEENINLVQLAKYEDMIQAYVARLQKHRQQPDLSLKYYQTLALTFSEIYFHHFFNDQSQLLKSLNHFLVQFNTRQPEPIPPFISKDLKKLAFWMATGSGKTLILHVNYWQILKYSTSPWDNILLITPNAGLSQQHYEECRLSGISCKLYDGNPDHLQTAENEILIIDIHKLNRQKSGRGVSVDIAWFEGRNLVFIDEGHKGQLSEEQKWKKLREDIAEQGMIVEYSATFGQVIHKSDFLMTEYSKSILFDYAYKYFFKDGFGKAFQVYNLQRSPSAKDFHYNLLTAALLSFYEQKVMFDSHGEELSRYQVEKPLWVFVGSRVAGKKLESDILKVIQFLKTFLEDVPKSSKRVDGLLSGKTTFLSGENKEIFRNKWQTLKENGVTAEAINKSLFAGAGPLELWEIKNADGEIGIKSANGKEYFGVVNVGNVSALKKLLMETGIEVRADYFSNSLFSQINHPHSPIHLLIGSKKFIEGWNSWRVSSMVLMNMGKGEGAQIVQLFGRGVRLRGMNLSLKRETEGSYACRAVQTLCIYGLNADYMNAFLNAIRAEDVSEEAYQIKETTPPVNGSTLPERKNGKQTYLKRNESIVLAYDENLIEQMIVDIRPRFSVIESEKAADKGNTKPAEIRLSKKLMQLIDWDALYLYAVHEKTHLGYYHLIIDGKVIKEVISGRQYTLLALQEQLEISRFDDIEKIQAIAEHICRKYIIHFYRKKAATGAPAT